MARAARHTRLETRTARLKLETGKRHRVTIGKGLILIYRRGPQGGTWSAKIEIRPGQYALRALGEADDYRDADGKAVLTFFQAQEEAREAWTELHRPPSAVTVNEAADHYLTWFRQHRKSADRTAGIIAVHIRPSLGNRKVAKLTTRDLRQWQNDLAAQPARRRTKRGAEQALAPLPATDEQRRARRATANRCLAVLKALLTGARYGELARLNVADFDPDRRSIYIAESKSGRPRYVPLSAEGAEFFQAQALGKGGLDPLLLNPHGARWGKNQYQRPLVEAYQAARIDLPARLHDCRHTYASLMAQAGADLLTISKLLGHADTRVASRHYAHLCDRTLAKAVETYLPGFGEPAMPDNVVTLREEPV